MPSKHNFWQKCQFNVRNVIPFLFLYIRSTIRPVSAVRNFFNIYSNKSSDFRENPSKMNAKKKTAFVYARMCSVILWEIAKFPIEKWNGNFKFWRENLLSDRHKQKKMRKCLLPIRNDWTKRIVLKLVRKRHGNGTENHLISKFV